MLKKFLFAACAVLLVCLSGPSAAAATFKQFEHPAKYILGADNFWDINFGFNYTEVTVSPKTFNLFIGGHCFVTADNKLLVPDRAHNRVMIYNTLPTMTGASADLVLGAPDLKTKGTGNAAFTDINATNVDNPFDARIGPNGQLIVVDRNTDRILIWNTFPTADNAPADIVLGQGSMTTHDNNYLGPDGASDRADLSNPEQAAIWGNKLAICDRENDRILIWNDMSTGKLVNGQPADVIVTGSGERKLSKPRGVAFGLAGQLVVGGKDQKRVLIWNTCPTADNAEPDIVIGQPNFGTTVDANVEENRTASVLCGEVQGVQVSPTGQLAVADNGRGAVMIWDNFPTASGQAADRLLGASAWACAWKVRISARLRP